jgi:hypothetical protein
VREIIDQSANIMGNFVFLDLARGLDRDPGQQAMSARDALDIIRIMILAVAGARLGRYIWIVRCRACAGATNGK